MTRSEKLRSELWATTRLPAQLHIITDRLFKALTEELLNEVVISSSLHIARLIISFKSVGSHKWGDLETAILSAIRCRDLTGGNMSRVV